MIETAPKGAFLLGAIWKSKVQMKSSKSLSD